MPRHRRRKTAWRPQEQRRLRVRGVRRGAPDSRKLSRAFINLALARAEAEAQAQAEATARNAGQVDVSDDHLSSDGGAEDDDVAG